MGRRAMVAAAFLVSAMMAAGFLGHLVAPAQVGPAAALLLLLLGASMFGLAPRVPGEVAEAREAPDNVEPFPLSLPGLRAETVEVE